MRHDGGVTARSVPLQPRFVNASEEDVWRKVVRQLPDDCVVLPNLRVGDDTKDHEIDLLVLMPGAGIVVVEVKGGSVWVDADGTWRIGDNPGRVIAPVSQARDALYAVRHYVENDPRWGTRRRVKWNHHVVLARTPLEDGFSTPECPRWRISGRGDLGEIGVRLWETCELHQRDARVLDADDVALIEEILGGHLLPTRDVVGLAEDREERANRLTLEQATLLDVTRLIKRLEIRGGAGSGKTVLAIRQAADLASGRRGPRQRVAVVCYSYGLAHHLRRELLIGSKGKRPAFVGTFEDLARSWGIEITGTREDTDYWEVHLPRQMAEVARGLADEQRFDAIIIDEAQDFADDWWYPLLDALRDEDASGLYAYSDEHQRVFNRFGRPPIALVPLVLDHNLRNTRQIAESFLPLAPTSMELRGGDGPEVTFVRTSVEDAIEVADAQVEALLDEGWEPRDVALLTMGSRHPVQRERQESEGFDAYWEGFWSNDDVFYGHVLGFKGMERRAVVLCVNEDGLRDRSRERLYVGLSRATDRLVVVGDPDAIRRMGGEEVAAELGC